MSLSFGENTKDAPQSSSDSRSNYNEIIVRFNGVLPDKTHLGNPETSERYAEIVKSGKETSTSCSIIVRDNRGDSPDSGFHILFDLGEGVVSSVEKVISELGVEKYQAEKNQGISSKLQSKPAIGSPMLLSTATSESQSSVVQEKGAALFDALLISHPHEDHIKDLAILVRRQTSVRDQTRTNKIRVYSTRPCKEHIVNYLLSHASLTEKDIENSIDFQNVTPLETFDVGPCSVMAIQAYHGGEWATDGAVIYVVNTLNTKIIFGWDFLSLPGADENLLWNPDLLVLGTETYNQHPETGMISVTEAYDLVRRWNAKECYIVHYGGLNDFEEARNQWFRGPVKPMSSTELQSTIDSHLKISGAQGKFQMIVAEEGTIWTRMKDGKDEGISHPTSSEQAASQIGNSIELEALEKYVLKVEKVEKIGKLKLVIEDRINRYDMVFENPRLEKRDNNFALYAFGEKGMLAKGPDLVAELERNSSTLKTYIYKGKKTVFYDDIRLGKNDAIKFEQYLLENFL
ncbi:MAG TPA: MBL fold metallo-hydrolase [Nitrososphaeraceae archaeon]|nr:MBL fold metallo-hydrolase [Nitrososphaeraceae archaeon]